MKLIMFLILFLFPLILILYKDLKRKNYENESLNNTMSLLLLAYFPVLFINELKELNNLYIYILILLILILIINVIPKLLKTQVYHYRIFDSKNEEHYIKEVENIIKTYSEKCLNKNSEISLDGKKIVFKNVDKLCMQECLYKINEFIEEQRSSLFSLKEYMSIYFKDMIKLFVFIVLGIFVLYFL